MEQQKHPCKFANAIETERDTRAKNKDKDTFQHTQKEQSRTEKGGIPTKFENRKKNKKHSTLVFIYLASARTVAKGKACRASYYEK